MKKIEEYIQPFQTVFIGAYSWQVQSIENVLRPLAEDVREECALIVEPDTRSLENADREYKGMYLMRMEFAESIRNLKLFEGELNEEDR